MNDLDQQPAAWVQSLAKVGAVLCGLIGTVWVLWTTGVIAFGGTVPLFGWQVGPDPLLGLLFLMFGEPLAMTVIYWAWMIIVIPLGLIFRQRSTDGGVL